MDSYGLLALLQSKAFLLETNMKNSQTEKERKKDTKRNILDFESKHNLIGFLNLLLEIDSRINPENYSKLQNYENNRGPDNTNKT